MIRKLLLAWLLIGIVLMAAGLAAGQVSYSEGPFGGQRFRAGPQGVQGGCYVGPGGQMQCGPGGCGTSSGGIRTAPGSPFGSPFGPPSGRPSNFPGGWRPPQRPSRPGMQPGMQPGVQSARQPGAPPPTFRRPAPGRGVTLPAQGSVARARTPSPVVVKIVSSRGDPSSPRGRESKIGTGALVDWRNGRGLVLTCAHILQAGYAPAVFFSDGSSVPAEILAADALHDCGLLTVRIPKRKVMRMAAAPPRSGPVYWDGYGGNGYATTRGRVLGVDGDFLKMQGTGREGDSGGPIYGPDGTIMAILSGGSQMPGQPWEANGPHIGWIREFIAQHWPSRVVPGGPVEPNSQAIKAALNALPPGTLVAGEPVYVPVTPESNAQIIASLHGIPIKGPIPDSPAASTPSPPVLPPPGSAVSIPAGPGPCAGLADLQSEIAELRKAIAALAAKQPTQPTAGPPGPPGNDGKIGPPGPPGPVSVPQAKPLKPWYLKGLDPETGREVVIPICPGDEVELLEPLNLQQVTIKKANK